MEGGKLLFREVCTVHQRVKWLLHDWVSVLPRVLWFRENVSAIQQHMLFALWVWLLQTRACDAFCVLYLLLSPFILYSRKKRLCSTSGVQFYRYKNEYLKHTKEQERKAAVRAACLHLVSGSSSWNLFLRAPDGCVEALPEWAALRGVHCALVGSWPRGDL